eukprot:2150807-Rhodomonas_salina.7
MSVPHIAERRRGRIAFAVPDNTSRHHRRAGTACRLACAMSVPDMAKHIRLFQYRKSRSTKA